MTGIHFLRQVVSGCRNSIFLCVRFIILTIRLHLWEHLSIISVLLMTERQHGRTISDFGTVEHIMKVLKEKVLQ